jgi:hypothetical protein
LTAQQTRDILLAAECKVYIAAGAEELDYESPRVPAWQHYTTPNVILHVNGEMEDWNVAPEHLYDFPNLETAIIGQ